jgi:hypothetical protein
MHTVAPVALYQPLEQATQVSKLVAFKVLEAVPALQATIEEVVGQYEPELL